MGAITTAKYIEAGKSSKIPALLQLFSHRLGAMRSHDLIVTGLERFVTESHCYLFKSVACGFDVIRPGQDGGGQTETRDDEVEVPANPRKSIWRDHADDEVEDLQGVSRGLLRIGRQQLTQLLAVARAIPLLRPRSGKISAGSSQGIGPHVIP